MIKQTKLLILLVCLFGFTEIVYCEKQWLIHQLETQFIMTNNQHHHHHEQQQHQSLNLRTHDRVTQTDIRAFIWTIRFILGPILFITTFPCIWFNEKRAAIDYRRLKLAEQISISVNPMNKNQIICANMKLTHVSGNTTTNDITKDEVANLIVSNAIKIIRKVEVKEWRATTHKSNNGRKEIIYSLDWQTHNVPNVQGKSNSPSHWFVQSQTIYNQNVRLGEYLLSQTQKELCKKQTQIHLNMNNINAILINKRVNVRPVIQENYVYFPPSTGGSIQDHGALRMEYSYCPIGPITLMAKSVHNTFQPFPISSYQSNGQIETNQLPAYCCISNCVAQLLKPIDDINLVEEEIMNKQKIVQMAVVKSMIMTWFIRIGSYVMMAIALLVFFSPIINLIGYVPFIGGLLKGAVGFTIFLVVLLLCIPLWIITFSLAWIWYHPKMGAIFLSIGVSILGVILLINHTSQVGTLSSSSPSSQTTTHLLKAWIS